MERYGNAAPGSMRSVSLTGGTGSDRGGPAPPPSLRLCSPQSHHAGSGLRRSMAAGRGSVRSPALCPRGRRCFVRRRLINKRQSSSSPSPPPPSPGESSPGRPAQNDDDSRSGLCKAPPPPAVEVVIIVAVVKSLSVRCSA